MLVSTRQHPNAMRTSIKAAITKPATSHSYRLNRASSTRDQRIPPRGTPKVTQPTARPLRFANHWFETLKAIVVGAASPTPCQPGQAVNRKEHHFPKQKYPHHSPAATPASAMQTINPAYVLQAGRQKKATRKQKHPTGSIRQEPWRSNSTPIGAANRQSRAAKTDVIHAMSSSERSRSTVSCQCVWNRPMALSRPYVGTTRQKQPSTTFHGFHPLSRGARGPPLAAGSDPPAAEGPGVVASGSPAAGPGDLRSVTSGPGEPGMMDASLRVGSLVSSHVTIFFTCHFGGASSVSTHSIKDESLRLLSKLERLLVR
ncbi:hypothetical protein VTI74DRAFT_7479 [Chaetomium olivicolor]